MMKMTNMIKYSMLFMLLGVSSLGFADTKSADPATVPLPQSGMNMQQVVTTFGQPAEQLPSTGKPPITVWRYADFNVYFEHQTVLHSVRFVPFVRPIEVVIESTGYSQP